MFLKGYNKVILFNTLTFEMCVCVCVPQWGKQDSSRSTCFFLGGDGEEGPEVAGSGGRGSGTATWLRSLCSQSAILIRATSTLLHFRFKTYHYCYIFTCHPHSWKWTKKHLKFGTFGTVSHPFLVWKIRVCVACIGKYIGHLETMMQLPTFT